MYGHNVPVIHLGGNSQYAARGFAGPYYCEQKGSDSKSVVGTSGMQKVHRESEYADIYATQGECEAQTLVKAGKEAENFTTDSHFTYDLPSPLVEYVDNSSFDAESMSTVSSEYLSCHSENDRNLAASQPSNGSTADVQVPKHSLETALDDPNSKSCAEFEKQLLDFETQLTRLAVAFNTIGTLSSGVLKCPGSEADPQSDIAEQDVSRSDIARDAVEVMPNELENTLVTKLEQIAEEVTSLHIRRNSLGQSLDKCFEILYLDGTQAAAPANELYYNPSLHDGYSESMRVASNPIYAAAEIAQDTEGVMMEEDSFRLNALQERIAAFSISLAESAGRARVYSPWLYSPGMSDLSSEIYY